MEELISRYKQELNDRISLKKTINKTNEQIILENFKYFDLTSSNYCNIDDFIKANERIGVKMKMKDDLYKVFNYYNNNHSGLINYRIFSKQILNNNSFDNTFIKNNYINNEIINDNKKLKYKRDNYNLRNKTSKENFIFNNDSKNKDELYKKNNNNIYNEKSTFNKNNKEKYDKSMNINYEEDKFENENNHQNNEYEYIDKNIPIIKQPYFEIILSYLLNNSNNLACKCILLFYKNFKVNQRRKLYNKISLEELMDIINNNKINLKITEIQTLYHYYQNSQDGYFYYEKFFDDLLDIYWDEERQDFTRKKIIEILNRNRNKDKASGNKKIKIEDFYNLISITKNNNYNIISVKNYFKNKLNIIYPDEYFNEIVRLFMEIKYLSTSNKDSSLNDKDLLQLIKFISFGIKLNQDFFKAINYIFNTNRYSSINKISHDYQQEENINNNKNKNSEGNFVNDKYNYNTSLSSLIIIRKYMIEHGIKALLKIIKELNYYSNGNRFVKKYDFAKVLKDYNIAMTVNDIEQIFDIFCEDKKKLYLNYYKFIEILLNEFITQERINLIKNIFKKIEKYLYNIGHYKISLESLENIYNSKNNYYQYNENQALNEFIENFIEFHYGFYIGKIYGGNMKGFNEIDHNKNFQIDIDEFLEFYKMISFIIEKDDMFRDNIVNEWNIALLNKINNKNDENDFINDNNINYRDDNENNDNKNRHDEEYDDYDDYNIKNNNYSPKNINYIKLKKDLTMNPSNNIKIFNQTSLIEENNYKPIQKIPIKKLEDRSNSNSFPIKEKNKILRHNSSQKQISNGNLYNNSHQIQQNYNNSSNNKSPLEKLTSKLKMRGLRGLMNLHKQFLFTCNNLSLISLSNFITVIKNQKISLENDECQQIFVKFRKENTKFLDFPKFIREFKKPLTGKRLEAVEDAFSKLDVDSNDNIFIDTIKRKYNPKGDPLVSKGLKNEEEVSTEFLDCFELNYNLLTAVENQNVSNIVSFEEFANFYEYVSFLYEDDDIFVNLVNNSWDD